MCYGIRYMGETLCNIIFMVSINLLHDSIVCSYTFLDIRFLILFNDTYLES